MSADVFGLPQIILGDSQLLLVLGVRERVPSKLLLLHNGRLDRILLRSLAPSSHLSLQGRVILHPSVFSLLYPLLLRKSLPFRFFFGLRQFAAAREDGYWFG